MYIYAFTIANAYEQSSKSNSIMFSALETAEREKKN